MRKLVLILLILSCFVMAGQRVSADKIIDQINAGQKVEYVNKIIVGSLDFTELKDMRQVNSSFGRHEEYASIVEVPIYFKDCNFKGEVLGYKYVNDEYDTYRADFQANVTFQNCDFKDKTEFKHSDFEEKAIFTNCSFSEEANFKHSNF
ncbi:MAG TPA: pentapeptide repeat-containing protein, partial [bacterium]|nr:pentapeptide repeat-containing protein [bacterium]